MLIVCCTKILPTFWFDVTYFQQAGQEKDKKNILEWTRDIVNHFWFSADVAKSVQEFMVCYDILYFNLILYLFQEDYIQPEATSSSPRRIFIVYIFYTATVPFEQSNCIDRILFCDIRSMAV